MKLRDVVGTFVVVGALIAVFATLQAGGWLSSDKRPERAVTLSVVWGDGTQIAGDAVVTWHTTSGGSHSVTVKGRRQPETGRDTGTESFVETILVRQGDLVILRGNPADHRVPVGTTITINNIPHAGGRQVEVTVP